MQARIRLTETATLRSVPERTRRVLIEGSSKKVSNHLASLYRGESAEVIERRKSWINVRDLSGRVGWLEIKATLPEAASTLATVDAEVIAYKKPDILARQTRRFAPGSLLIRLGEKNEFARVNFGGHRQTWVHKDQLITDSKAVDLAKLMARINGLKTNRDRASERAELIELAKADFDPARVSRWLGEDPPENAPRENTTQTQEEQPIQEPTDTPPFDRFLAGELEALTPGQLPYEVSVSRTDALRCHQTLHGKTQEPPQNHALLTAGWTPTAEEWRKRISARPSPPWRPRPLPDLCR